MFLLCSCRQQEYARSKREEKEEDAVQKIQDQAEKVRAASGLNSHSSFNPGDMADISHVVIDMGTFTGDLHGCACI